MLSFFFFFWSETWLDREQMVKIKERLAFDDLFVVSNDGRGGGLALHWRGGVQVWVDSFSKYHIDSIIDRNSENAWWLIGFYGELDTNHGTEGQITLYVLNSKPKLPWVFFLGL